MKSVFVRWSLILLLSVAALLGIHYYSYSHLHPSLAAIRPFVGAYYLEPLDRESYRRLCEKLPADFRQDVILSSLRRGFTVRNADEVALRRNADMMFEVICIDGYSHSGDENQKAVIRRALIRTDLALSLARLWQLELMRSEPVTGLGVGLDSTGYYFSTQTADGKILLGSADESNNENCLLQITDWLGFYVLSEPEHRPSIEKELDRLVTAGLANRGQQ